VKSAFPGFPKEGMDFLRGLKKNNQREWFQPRKDVFEQKVKAPMVELIAALQRDLKPAAPEMADGDAAKAVYRIYRDTRFSPDKTPYKTRIAALLPRAADKTGAAALYFSVSPEGIEVGGGMYMIPSPLLPRVRQHIAADPGRLRKILAAKALHDGFGALHGDQLKRIPQGFPADHPAADLLRYKGYFVFASLAGKLATGADLHPELLRRFKAMLPLIRYLNEVFE